jgi:hypothetical protein
MRLRQSCLRLALGRDLQGAISGFVAATEYYDSCFCLLCIDGSSGAGLPFIPGTDVGRHLLYSLWWVLCLIFKDLCVCPNIMLASIQDSPPKVDASVPRCLNSTSRPIGQE